jgi:hypothetical protein
LVVSVFGVEGFAAAFAGEYGLLDGGESEGFPEEGNIGIGVEVAVFLSGLEFALTGRVLTHLTFEVGEGAPTIPADGWFFDGEDAVGVGFPPFSAVFFEARLAPTGNTGDFVADFVAVSTLIQGSVLFHHSSLSPISNTRHGVSPSSDGVSIDVIKD